MSLHVQNVRLAVVVAWDKDALKGHYATISTARPGGELVERKQVVNHGGAVVYFPHDFHGEFEFQARGSSDGQVKGLLSL